ncbi:MAG: hypothetical protein PHD72_02930 [Patescibacteria group bacterium]|nr:hypothetical protein [Patescibacteria group bacterium]
MILKAVARSRPIPRGWFWFLLVMSMPIAVAVLGNMYLAPLMRTSQVLPAVLAVALMWTAYAIQRSITNPKNSGDGNWLVDFWNKNVIGRTIYFYLDKTGELQWGICPKEVRFMPGNVVINFSLGGWRRETAVMFGERDLRRELNPKVVLRPNAEKWVVKDLVSSAPPVVIDLPRFDTELHGGEIFQLPRLIRDLAETALFKEEQVAAKKALN